MFLCSRTAAQKDCWGKSSLEKGLDLSEFLNSELFLKVKKNIRCQPAVTIQILSSYSGMQLFFLRIHVSFSNMNELNA